MNTMQTIFFFISQSAMIIVAVMLIRLINSKIGRERTKDSKLALDYIFTLIAIKDQYRAYGFEAEAKELDEDIKKLLKKIDL